MSLMDGTRAVVCAMRLSIHTFKNEYLCDQVADHNQILSEASSHRIGGNRERRVLNTFMFSIAKINVFDCQNRYNGNGKRLI